MLEWSSRRALFLDRITLSMRSSLSILDPNSLRMRFSMATFNASVSDLSFIPASSLAKGWLNQSINTLEGGLGQTGAQGCQDLADTMWANYIMFLADVIMSPLYGACRKKARQCQIRRNN